MHPKISGITGDSRFDINNLNTIRNILYNTHTHTHTPNIYIYIFFFRSLVAKMLRFD